MDFAKTNLFKKFQDEIPIGLCALGLKRVKQKSKKKSAKKASVYPKFFAIDRISPVGV